MWKTFTSCFHSSSAPHSSRQTFNSFLKKNKRNNPLLKSLISIADLRSPIDWFPGARQMKRRIILHVGPTNSGKTHAALQRLRNSSSGIYCAPLRLLAYQVYHSLNTDHNLPCRLVTGEETRGPSMSKLNIENSSAVAFDKDGIITPDNPLYKFISQSSGQDDALNSPRHTSLTIEMANLNTPLEVAVLDEIQMIADAERGWAWTNALLGLQASEIHCCGEESAVDIVSEIAKSTGDELEINRYARLNSLHVSPSINRDISLLERGDALIAFSRREIFELKKSVEKERPDIKCAVVYGGLPPETRIDQANLFNSDDNDYNVLIASDAIGMGLNLNIRRIIFSSVKKYDGNSLALLSPRHVKQIAGRGSALLLSKFSLHDINCLAGRYKQMTVDGLQEPGYISTMSPDDWKYIKKCMNKENKGLTAACLAPTVETIEKYAELLPEKDAKFSAVLGYFEEMAKLDGTYFLCNFELKKELADTIQHFPLSIAERYLFVNVPMRSTPLEKQIFIQLVHGYILNIRNFDDDMNDELRPADIDDIFSIISKSSKKQNKGSELPPKFWNQVKQNGISLRHLSETYFNIPNDSLEEVGNAALSSNQLLQMEGLHRICVAYLWLNYRFPRVFSDRMFALENKHRLELLISRHLSDEAAV